jgi:acetyltransferase
VRRHGVPEAEFAIEITDPFQRQGLGTRLLQLLVDIGRQEGLERIFGYILPDNYSMLQLAKKVGFTVTFDRLETVMWAELKLWQTN